MKTTKYLLLALFFGAHICAKETIREEQLTRIIFRESDFGRSTKIERDIGLRLGCHLNTPSFNVHPKNDMEIAALIKYSGSWSDFPSTFEEATNIELARIDLKYRDGLGFVHRNSQFLLAQDFGPVLTRATSPEGALVFGNTNGVKAFHVAPRVLPMGSQNVTISICQIAARTAFEIESIEVRITPVR